MKHGKFVLMFFVSALLIFSCSKKTVNMQKSEKQVSVSKDSSGVKDSLTKTDVVAAHVDKTVTEVNEKADTAVKTKADTATINIPLNVNPGDTEVVHAKVKSGAVTLDVHYSPKTGKIKVNAIKDAEDVRFKFDRTVKTQNDIKDDFKQTQETKTHTEAKVSEDSTAKEKNMARHRTRSGVTFGTSFLIGLFLLIFILIMIAIWYIRKRAKKLSNAINTVTDFGNSQ